MSEKYYCMVMRLNIDCNACCRKLRRIILRMKEEIESHVIEKQQRRLIVCGRFVPSDVAIKIKRKMNRRVEILEVEEFSVENDQNQQPSERPPSPVPKVVYPGQVATLQQAVPIA